MSYDQACDQVVRAEAYMGGRGNIGLSPPDLRLSYPCKLLAKSLHGCFLRDPSKARGNLHPLRGAASLMRGLRAGYHESLQGSARARHLSNHLEQGPCGGQETTPHA